MLLFAAAPGARAGATTVDFLNQPPTGLGGREDLMPWMEPMIPDWRLPDNFRFPMFGSAPPLPQAGQRRGVGDGWYYLVLVKT